MPLLHHIKVQNLLSFGEKGISLPLRPLNVLIGPNGAGKSNLLEIVSLLQHAPKDLSEFVRKTGGIGNLLHKRTRAPIAEVEVIIDIPTNSCPIRHVVHFLDVPHVPPLFSVTHERVEDAGPDGTSTDGAIHFRSANGRPVLIVDQNENEIPGREYQFDQSVLSQLKDATRYPELTAISRQYERIRFFREWSFGRETAPRLPQRTDQRNDYLDEQCSNLGMVLNKLRRDPAAKARLLEALQRLYAGIDDFDVIIEGGSVQVFLQEGSVNIPATRLSDGTLRYLCLLAILCHPTPPPLVCIEEPELGLHPDVVVAIGELLKEASQRMQLIVTTHSDTLVDVFSSSPEDVIICEKENGETRMERLNGKDLAVWLSEYSLGHLWRRGDIGGNRW